MYVHVECRIPTGTYTCIHVIEQLVFLLNIYISIVYIVLSIVYVHVYVHVHVYMYVLPFSTQRPLWMLMAGPTTWTIGLTPWPLNRADDLNQTSLERENFLRGG